MIAFLSKLEALQPGYTTGSFAGSKYGITYQVSDDRRRRNMFAEELGGNDFISFNLYFGKNGNPILKPCEMPEQKVIDFVTGVQLDR